MAASHLPASLSSATVAELRNYMRAHGISGISKPKEQLRAAISDYHAHRDELLQLALGITPIANIQKHFPHIKVTGAEQTQDRILQHIRQTIARYTGTQKYTREKLIAALTGTIGQPEAQEASLAQLEWRVYLIASTATDVASSSLKQRKQKITPALRALIWDTHMGSDARTGPCFVCGTEIDVLTANYHVGHIIPESQGGSLTVDNLRPICATCNLRMGTRNMMEYKKIYDSYKVQISTWSRFWSWVWSKRRQ